MKKLLFITSLLMTSHSFASDKAIYGVDSRIDVKDSKNPQQKTVAKSVAVMIPQYVIWDVSETKTTFMDLTLRDTMQVCDNERFADQQTVATCTGFLVAPNKLVTAGHCVQNQSDCSSNKWVFDYQLNSNSPMVGSVNNDAVYSCKSIVESKLTRSIFSKTDWAVIELDRPVKGRTPLKLSRKAPSRGDNVYVVGSPSGLPLKIATGKVRAKRLKHFVTNLDTFAGNSGSPVLNAKTHEVEGILVRGAADYDSYYCNSAVKYKEDGGRGEDVSYIKDARLLLNLK